MVQFRCHGVALPPLAAILGILLCAQTEARFYYPHFNDLTQLTLVGMSRKVESCLQLTDAIPNEAGSAWYSRAVDVSRGFFTAFNFRIAPSKKGSSSSGEGLAFVLHREHELHKALGLGGIGLGYSGIKDSYAVEFDTSSSPANNDPKEDHVALHLPSGGSHSAKAYEKDMWLVRTNIPQLATGKTLTVQVSYDGETLKVFLNDLVNPIIEHKLRITGEYYVGFTGATGLDSSKSSSQKVCDWYFESKRPGGELCDDGFIGSSCIVDSTPSVSECLKRTTCFSCLSYYRDCNWCSSQLRCVAGAVSGAGHGHTAATTGGLQHSFCDNSQSIVTREAECLNLSHDFSQVWNNFIMVLSAVFVFSLVGRAMTAVERGGAWGGMGSDESTRLSMSLAFKARQVEERAARVNMIAEKRNLLCGDNTGRVHHAFDLICSTCAGALCAIVVSYTVNYCLYLLTLSHIYSIAFGFLFIFVGSIILWQTLIQYFDHDLTYAEQKSVAHCAMLCFCSVFLMMSGVVCFVFDPRFQRRESTPARVALYGILGISMCFSMVFVLVDLMRRASNSFWGVRKSVPLVAHSVYTRLLVASSCVSGLYFGFVFGKMGAGDANTTSIELALKQYNYYYYPVGCLLGGALAFVNRFLTLPERHSTPEDKYMDDQDGL